MAKVGFIGVGAMGGAMAVRMMAAGIPILAYDANPEVLAGVVAKGAEGASSVREVVDGAGIVFTCLPNADICRKVALGEAGIIEGKAVRIQVEVSTIGGEPAIEIATALAAKGITFLDAPVVGGTVALEQGTMGVLVAGDEAAFSQAKFAIDAVAQKIFYLGGEVGAAQVGKVMANAVSYAALCATCEALAMGIKGGIDPDTAMAIINQGSGMNFHSQVTFPKLILNHVFSGTGPITVGQKDVKLFLAEAERMGIETPMATATSAVQKRVVESGDPGRDTLTYPHFFTDLAGVPRLT